MPVKLEWSGWKNCENMLSRFHLISERYGQTDRQTDRIAISISPVSVLVCDKNWTFISWHQFMVIWLVLHFKDRRLVRANSAHVRVSIVCQLQLSCTELVTTTAGKWKLIRIIRSLFYRIVLGTRTTCTCQEIFCLVKKAYAIHVFLLLYSFSDWLFVVRDFGYDRV